MSGWYSKKMLEMSMPLYSENPAAKIVVGEKNGWGIFLGLCHATGLCTVQNGDFLSDDDDNNNIDSKNNDNKGNYDAADSHNKLNHNKKWPQERQPQQKQQHKKTKYI